MLCNNPENFRDEMLDGYVAAYPRYVVRVPGGVARVSATPEGKVAVVNGGGSGHYPAFCGIIGEGFVDATVVGNVFTSPSTDDMYGVASSVNAGSGVFIVGGNYAGDRMNFDLARDRLRAEGVDARTFYITDDIASAAPAERDRRRGNVGTFTVFKAAGAAAAAGAGLDEVERLARKCNDATRTFSIGLRGCTLPGQSGPLFRVPEGKMEIGQGIHGEAGVGEDDLRSADEIAELLVERVLSEKPSGSGNRLAVILDGLGSTKYEELFVVWRRVAALFAERGLEPVEPLVGEYVTSLDMEGIALAVTFLDDELERLWLAPADTPSFRRGDAVAVAAPSRVVARAAENRRAFGPASAAARAWTVRAAKAFAAIADVMVRREDEFARIDSVAGDGDHGRGMVKGSAAAKAAIESAAGLGAGFGSALVFAGEEWAAKAGGTSGVLLGNAIAAAGRTIGDDFGSLGTAAVASAVRSAAERIEALGGAKRGDKTLLDALLPFADRLAAEGGLDPASAWKLALGDAAAGAAATAGMLAKVGRARPQAERALGTPDAGAVSLVAALECVTW